MALLDPGLSATHRKTFIEVLGELDRISEIINNLLSLNTLTRPERMSFGNVDLGHLTTEVIKRHAGLAHEREIKIVVKKDAHRIVWGNSVALEQVITNLLKNALSYTPKGGGGLITVSIHPDYHGMILLSVADNGIGIGKEDLFHIFEPFYRADMSRVRRIKRSGSGLGLTIVNEIVRVHHGKIQIQSALKQGTTASVFLPAGIPEEAGAASEHRRDQTEVSIDFSKSSSALQYR